MSSHTPLASQPGRFLTAFSAVGSKCTFFFMGPAPNAGQTTHPPASESAAGYCRAGRGLATDLAVDWLQPPRCRGKEPIRAAATGGPATGNCGWGSAGVRAFSGGGAAWPLGTRDTKGPGGAGAPSVTSRSYIQASKWAGPPHVTRQSRAQACCLSSPGMRKGVSSQDRAWFAFNWLTSPVGVTGA